jgi:hypothetical protein
MLTVWHFDRPRAVRNIFAQTHLGDLIDHARVVFAVAARGPQQLELATMLALVQTIDMHKVLRLKRQSSRKQ